MSVLAIIAIILGILGIIGSVVPGLPGPPLSWVGLLLLYFAPLDDPVTVTGLIVWFVVVAVVTVVDYIFPATMTKAMGGHKAASIGAVVGLFLGMFLTPIGMIGGSLLGAFLAELLIDNGGVFRSFKASIGAFLGFILTTGLKLICAGILLWVIIKHLV